MKWNPWELKNHWGTAPHKGIWHLCNVPRGSIDWTSLPVHPLFLREKCVGWVRLGHQAPCFPIPHHCPLRMVLAMPSHSLVLWSQAAGALLTASGNPLPPQTIGVHDQQPGLRVRGFLQTTTTKKGFLSCRAESGGAGRWVWPVQGLIPSSTIWIIFALTLNQLFALTFSKKYWTWFILITELFDAHLNFAHKVSALQDLPYFWPWDVGYPNDLITKWYIGSWFVHLIFHAFLGVNTKVTGRALEPLGEI